MSWKQRVRQQCLTLPRLVPGLIFSLQSRKYPDAR